MFYDFGLNAEENLIDEIDIANVLKKLQKKHNMSYGELRDNIKELIKTPKIFYEHIEEFKIDKKEYIILLVKAFPGIWNYHTIKFVKEYYLK